MLSQLVNASLRSDSSMDRGDPTGSRLLALKNPFYRVRPAPDWISIIAEGLFQARDRIPLPVAGDIQPCAKCGQRSPFRLKRVFIRMGCQSRRCDNTQVVSDVRDHVRSCTGCVYRSTNLFFYPA